MTERDRKIAAAAIRAGIRHMLNRQKIAYDDFIVLLTNIVGDDAEAAYRGLKKAKAIKYDGARYTVKHGAFLEASALRNAAAYAVANKL